MYDNKVPSGFNIHNNCKMIHDTVEQEDNIRKNQD